MSRAGSSSSEPVEGREPGAHLRREKLVDGAVEAAAPVRMLVDGAGHVRLFGAPERVLERDEGEARARARDETDGGVDCALRVFRPRWSIGGDPGLAKRAPQ